LNAAVCGHFGVPVLMVSGDQRWQEALDLLGKIEVAAIKHATGRMSAECLPHRSPDENLRGSRAAVSRLKTGDALRHCACPHPCR